LLLLLDLQKDILAFDYLKEEGVEVVYLPRTKEISTTKIKEDLAD